MSIAYAPPTLDVARQRITALLDGYRAATGLPTTFVGILARGGDPKFCRNYLSNDFGFRSYDAVNSRLSAVWPKDTPWPADVPRLAPAVIEQKLIDELHKRLNRLSSQAAETPKEQDNG